MRARRSGAAHTLEGGPAALLRVILGVLPFTLGCSSPPVHPERFEANTKIVTEWLNSEYRLRPGDTLRVDIFPPLPPVGQSLEQGAGTSSIEARVRTDGRIALPRLGEFQVRGRTSEHLAGEITRVIRDKSLVERPDVVIQVVESEKLVVYVEGEVLEPGRISYEPTLTAMEAVAHAGGVYWTGDEGEVILLRRDFEGQIAARLVDLVSMRAGEVDDIALLPGDIIHVPPTEITVVDRWVEQYIRGLLPVGFGPPTLTVPR